MGSNNRLEEEERETFIYDCFNLLLWRNGDDNFGPERRIQYALMENVEMEGLHLDIS